MAIIERANVVLEIEDDEDLIQKYLAKGYCVTDGRGHVLRETLSYDVGTLQAKVVKLQKELQKKNQMLAEKDIALAEKDAEITKLKSRKKKAN